MSIVRALYELVFVRVYIIVFCIRFVSSFADACRYLIVFWHLYPFLPLLVCMHNDWLMSQVSCSMSSLMLCKKKKKIENWNGRGDIHHDVLLFIHLNFVKICSYLDMPKNCNQDLSFPPLKCFTIGLTILVDWMIILMLCLCTMRK